MFCRETLDLGIHVGFTLTRVTPLGMVYQPYSVLAVVSFFCRNCAQMIWSSSCSLGLEVPQISIWFSICADEVLDKQVWLMKVPTHSLNSLNDLCWYQIPQHVSWHPWLNSTALFWLPQWGPTQYLTYMLIIKISGFNIVTGRCMLII